MCQLYNRETLKAKPITTELVHENKHKLLNEEWTFNLCFNFFFSSKMLFKKKSRKKDGPSQTTIKL